MGKLLVLVVTVVLLGLVIATAISVLRQSDTRNERDVKNAKKRIAELQEHSTRQTAVLKDVRQIAEDAASATSDPAFDLIIDRVDQLLRRQGRE